MGGDELKPVVSVARYQNSTTEDAVIVPGLQAVITALPIGILAGVMVAWLQWPLNGFVVAFVVFLVAFIAAWLGYRGYWTGLIESVLLMDLNHDGHIGFEPEPKLPELPVRVIQDETHQQMFGLPYPEQAMQLARGLAGGETFSGRAWAGKGRTFSDAEWNEFTRVLRERGLAVWKNPRAVQQGMDLTAAGRAVFRELARMGRDDLQIIQTEGRAYASETEPPAPPWGNW